MTDKPRKSLKYVTDLRKQVDSNVALVKGDLQIPTTRYHPDTPRGKGAVADNTRVASEAEQQHTRDRDIDKTTATNFLARLGPGFMERETKRIKNRGGRFP